ncbi:hypothetical protein [Quatrionicoccus australiensis]|uniref:hypothetical protein n=1 Tax=Quatrionicoccus australiensis TaxID=138118 RepID=UPI001CF888D6|nr:hypothetical protein [Quatrionicoccus australiensis]UCV16694.1 hypothetical protein KI612_08490 [Quatrionicoccus australiensis]
MAVTSRLFPALALSLLLHLAVAIAVRPPPTLRAAQVVVLEARLSPAAPFVRVGPLPMAGESKRASQQLAVKRASTEAAAETVSSVAATSPGHLTRDAILATAREIARAEGYGAPRQAVAIADHALLPGVAKALENKGAGTRVSQYSNGMIKVESAAGTTYCLQPPPAIPQVGMPTVSVAVTCPW